MDEDSDDEEYLSITESEYEDCYDIKFLGTPRMVMFYFDKLPWHLLSKSQRKGILRRMAKRRETGINQSQKTPRMQVYGKLNQHSDARAIALLRKGYLYRDLYDASIKWDPTFDYDAYAQRIRSILTATDQWQPKILNSKPLEVIMFSSDYESNPGARTDPTYKVDFTLLHCGTYGLKLAKTLLNYYPDIFARYKYDLGLAKVDPVEIPTTDLYQLLANSCEYHRKYGRSGKA